MDFRKVFSYIYTYLCSIHAGLLHVDSVNPTRVTSITNKCLLCEYTTKKLWKLYAKMAGLSMENIDNSGRL